MIPITDVRIESYLSGIIPENDLQRMAMEEKARNADFPIVGRQVGRLLYLLTRLKQPALVVELGSGFGYSGYWFARALKVGGRVVLIDQAEENMAYARRLFQVTGLSERVECRVGDALRVGPEYDNIDLLFIDLDKDRYPEAMEVMLPHLAPHALVVADNCLWHGKVAEEGTRDRETEGILRFNDYMLRHPNFFCSIVPLRDGVLLAYRLS